MSSPKDEDEVLLAALLSGELPLDSEQGQQALDRCGLDRDAFDDLKAIADELDYRSLVEEAAQIANAPGSESVAATLQEAAGQRPAGAPIAESPVAESPFAGRAPSPPPRPRAVWFAAVAAAAAALVLTVALRGGAKGEDQGNSNLAGKTLGQASQDTTALTIDEGRLAIPYSLRAGDAMDVAIEGRVGTGEWETRIQASVTSAVLMIDEEELADLRRFDELRLTGTLDSADGSRLPLFAQPPSVKVPR